MPLWPICSGRPNKKPARRIAPVDEDFFGLFRGEGKIDLVVCIVQLVNDLGLIPNDCRLDKVVYQALRLTHFVIGQGLSLVVLQVAREIHSDRKSVV